MEKLLPPAFLYFSKNYGPACMESSLAGIVKPLSVSVRPGGGCQTTGRSGKQIYAPHAIFRLFRFKKAYNIFMEPPGRTGPRHSKPDILKEDP